MEKKGKSKMQNIRVRVKHKTVLVYATAASENRAIYYSRFLIGEGTLKRRFPAGVSCRAFISFVRRGGI